jgi:hypothetical protein
VALPKFMCDSKVPGERGRVDGHAVKFSPGLVLKGVGQLSRELETAPPIMTGQRGQPLVPG